MAGTAVVADENRGGKLAATTGPGRLLNFKVDEDVRAYLLRAFEASGVKSFSEWARSALVVAATRELRLADEGQRQADAVSTITEARMRAATLAAGGSRVLGRTTVGAECLHPVQAVRHLPFEDRCGLCGILVRSKLGQRVA